MSRQKDLDKEIKQLWRMMIFNNVFTVFLWVIIITLVMEVFFGN